ncbi:Detected protein of confused Function [Hibiscus syriacus]|uniref:O-fucosyltransferase family protein n=1 Tax=Hibiscus syriacus TaxID=106335 RepID=A0A6A2XGN1_HIBSY|nr:Detected protein of confused Function [Hibiscus syriacus]
MKHHMKSGVLSKKRIQAQIIFLSCLGSRVKLPISNVVHGRILITKPLPSIVEVFFEDRREESQWALMGSWDEFQPQKIQLPLDVPGMRSLNGENIAPLIDTSDLPIAQRKVSIPKSMEETIKCPRWKQVVEEEINVLEANKTWVMTIYLREKKVEEVYMQRPPGLCLNSNSGQESGGVHRCEMGWRTYIQMSTSGYCARVWGNLVTWRSVTVRRDESGREEGIGEIRSQGVRSAQVSSPGRVEATQIEDLKKTVQQVNDETNPPKWWEAQDKRISLLESRMATTQSYMEQILGILTRRTEEQVQNSPEIKQMLHMAIEDTNDRYQVLDKLSTRAFDAIPSITGTIKIDSRLQQNVSLSGLSKLISWKNLVDIEEQEQTISENAQVSTPNLLKTDGIKILEKLGKKTATYYDTGWRAKDKLVSMVNKRVNHDAKIEKSDVPYVPCTHEGLLMWKYALMNSNDFLIEKNLNTTRVDCCIGIHVDFTDFQRKVVLDTATIAVACGVWHTSTVVEVIVTQSTTSVSSGKLFTWGMGTKIVLDMETKKPGLSPREYIEENACGAYHITALTSSGFKDLFDWQYFIETLKDDVHIVEAIPPEYTGIEPFNKMHISWSKVSYYKAEVLPLLKQQKAIYFIHTDSRLANNGISSSIKKLRCWVNYKALKYSIASEELGITLISRMRQNGSPYLALHLRYEMDMLAFTGCSHSLTIEEDNELSRMRHKVGHWKENEINGTERRLLDGCSLTPRETFLLLRVLGFPPSTRIYLVDGEAYGNGSMEPLKEDFPNIFSHSSLATDEELNPFKNHQNMLAGLDSVVALQSDVIVYTYDGNMTKAFQGHRRIENFKKTICPDMMNFVKLVDYYDERESGFFRESENSTKCRNSASVTNGGQAEADWIEKDKPGVYITLVALQDGTRDLKRVRFSWRRFGEQQAESWWSENREKVVERYWDWELTNETQPIWNMFTNLTEYVGYKFGSIEVGYNGNLVNYKALEDYCFSFYTSQNLIFLSALSLHLPLHEPCRAIGKSEVSQHTNEVWYEVKVNSDKQPTLLWCSEFTMHMVPDMLQNIIKQHTEKNRSERQFQRGKEEYLRLRPYRKTSIVLQKNLKLAAIYYGSYKIIAKIGEVAYRLDLPDFFRLHPIFHVSILKIHVSDSTVSSTDSPAMDDDDLDDTSDTWEDDIVLRGQFPGFDPWGQGSIPTAGIVTVRRDESGRKEGIGEIRSQGSSAEAEFRALAQGICEGIQIQRLLAELKLNHTADFELNCDKQSVTSIAKNPVHYYKEKHVELDRHFFSEKVTNGTVKPFFVSTR